MGLLLITQKEAKSSAQSGRTGCRESLPCLVKISHGVSELIASDNSVGLVLVLAKLTGGARNVSEEVLGTVRVAAAVEGDSVDAGEHALAGIVTIPIRVILEKIFPVDHYERPSVRHVSTPRGDVPVDVAQRVLVVVAIRFLETEFGEEHEELSRAERTLQVESLTCRGEAQHDDRKRTLHGGTATWDGVRTI